MTDVAANSRRPLPRRVGSIVAVYVLSILTLRESLAAKDADVSKLDDATVQKLEGAAARLEVVFPAIQAAADQGQKRRSKAEYEHQSIEQLQKTLTGQRAELAEIRGIVRQIINIDKANQAQLQLPNHIVYLSSHFIVRRVTLEHTHRQLQRYLVDIELAIRNLELEHGRIVAQAKDDAARKRDRAGSEAWKINEIHSGRATGGVIVETTVERDGNVIGKSVRGASPSETTRKLRQVRRDLDARPRFSKDAIRKAGILTKHRKTLTGLSKTMACAVRDLVNVQLASKEKDEQLRGLQNLDYMVDQCGKPSLLTAVLSALESDSAQLHDAAAATLIRLRLPSTELHQLIHNDSARVRDAALIALRESLSIQRPFSDVHLLICDDEVDVRKIGYDCFGLKGNDIPYDSSWSALKHTAEPIHALHRALTHKSDAVVLDALAFVNQLPKYQIPAAIAEDVRVLANSEQFAVSRSAFLILQK